MTSRRTLAVLLVAAATGCASTNKATRAPPTAQPAPQHVDMEPAKVVAKPATPDALSVYDAETLYNRGMEFLDGRYYADARLYFQRVLDEFPDSSFVHGAHYNLGVALMEGGDPASALMHFDAYLAGAKTPHDRVDGLFKRGSCLAMLGRYADVVALFDELIGEGNLEPHDYIEANVDAGIGHFMLGDRATAEYRFREAVKTHKSEEKQARVDNKYFYAQALFYLAEIERMDFMDVKLVMPAKGKEEDMAALLEKKCDRLLSAQFKFLQVIRTGHPGWAGAAGYKVGSMYEDLHDEMTTLPTPPEMDADQQDIYRRELRRRVSVLIRKAIKTYETTVEMARRTGTNTVWVEKTQKSLERMQQLLADAEKDESQHS